MEGAAASRAEAALSISLLPLREKVAAEGGRMRGPPQPSAERRRSRAERRVDPSSDLASRGHLLPQGEQGIVGSTRMTHPATHTRDTAPRPQPVGRARRAATGLWRWRWAPTVLAIVAGLLAAVAQPPWGVLPGLLGYGLMFRLVDAASGAQPLRSAFFRGWLTGVAYFVVSLWWIDQPFKVDAQNQGWMAPFADPVVSMFMALFWGAASALYRRFASRHALRALFFAACLSLAEWLRGHILTGFPWDLPGETWRAGGPISQAAALGGAYGLTFFPLAGAAGHVLGAEGGRGARLALAAVAVFVALVRMGANGASATRRLPARRRPWCASSSPTCARRASTTRTCSPASSTATSPSPRGLRRRRPQS